jgi:microcystin-dependent protein
VSEPYVGEIQAFPYNWAVNTSFNQAWMPCMGQSLSVNAFAALYALIGTLYGGNGTTNFNLPNLGGFITNSQGNGPGLQPRVMGSTIGTSTVILNASQMAQHTHGLQIGSRSAANPAPGPGKASNMAAIDPGFSGFVAPPTTTTFATNAMAMTGGGQSHDNMQPYQAITWCICYNGIFPVFPTATS